MRSSPTRTAAASPLLHIVLLAGLLTLLLPPLWSPLLAQGSTRAAIEGRVVDVDGEPLPGVTITIDSPTVAMPPAGTVTDAEGRFRVLHLTPRSNYRLVAELAGYARMEVQPIDLSPGRTRTLDLSLLPASQATERVQVTAESDIIDLNTVKTSTVFNAEFIDGLPIIGRNYQSLLTLAPGVTDVDGDGNPNVNGARDTEFQTLVDGANTTDPFSGKYGQNLNIEAIAEIEVITTGASSEFSRAQGGFGNIITKSGGNEFEGSFKFFYRSDLFDNDGVNNNDVTAGDVSDDLDGFEDIRPFLTLGGPFIKNRLWYFLALEYISLETPINAGLQAFLETEEGWNNFGKVTWQLSPSHRMALQFNYDPRRFEGQNLGSGVAPESDYSLETGGLVSTLRWTANLSPSILLETLVSRYDTKLDREPISQPGRCTLDSVGLCNPFSLDLYTIDERAGLTTGPYFQTHNDDRIRDTLKSDLSLFLDGRGGQHNLKIGAEYSHEDYSNDLDERPRRFDNFFLESIPSECPDGTVRCPDRQCVPPDRVAFDCDARDFVGVVNFQESFPDSQVRDAEKDHFGFYLQDSYRPLPNLSLNLGLRFDRDDSKADGWEPFDPRRQARRFIDILARDRNVDPASLDLAESFTTIGDLSDLNHDGRDSVHCGGMADDLDNFNNALVTGFLINENGSYTLVGDESLDANGNGIADYREPDNLVEDFFEFRDAAGENICVGGSNNLMPCDQGNGNGDCPFGTCGTVDGAVRFDPSLADLEDPITLAGDYADPTQCTGGGECDAIYFIPGGGATGRTDGDATSLSPNCDRLNDDAKALLSVYTRHQMDFEEGPFEFVDGTLPGNVRRRDTIRITNDNLAPRLSLSWDPWSDNKTKIFASWGRYYGTLHLETLIPEQGPEERFFTYDANLMRIGSQARPFQIGRFSAVQVDRDLDTPFTDEFTVGFERELAPHWAVMFLFINREARNQLQDVDINHFTRDLNNDGELDDFIGIQVPPSLCNPDPDPGDDTVPCTSFLPDGLADLQGFSPFFSEVLRVGNLNASDYRSYQLSLTRRLSRRWQMTTSYVYSETEGDAESFNSVIGNDLGTIDEARGPLDYDQTHVGKFSAVVFLPLEQRVGAAILYASGLPYSIVRGPITSTDSLGSTTVRTGFPSNQRNDQRNSSAWLVNLSYQKELRFSKVRGAVEVEVQNLLNTDDLRILEENVSTQLGVDSERQFGRRWQLSLQFHF